jgi:hypothetical protein
MPRSSPAFLDVASLTLPGLYGAVALLAVVGGLRDGEGSTPRGLAALLAAAVLLALTVLVWRGRARTFVPGGLALLAAALAASSVAGPLSLLTLLPVACLVVHGGDLLGRRIRAHDAAHDPRLDRLGTG